MIRELTTKQEAFAQACLEPENNATDAYRLAYDASNMTPEAVNTEAFRLVHHPKISLRIQELRKEIIGKREWGLDRVIDELEANVYLGRELNQISASTGAIVQIGKAVGVLIDKVDINVTHTLKPGMSLEELEARHERLLALKAAAEDGVVDSTGEVVD